jgi:hypothetical protein
MSLGGARTLLGLYHIRHHVAHTMDSTRSMDSNASSNTRAIDDST